MSLHTFNLPLTLSEASTCLREDQDSLSSRQGESVHVQLLTSWIGIFLVQLEFSTHSWGVGINTSSSKMGVLDHRDHSKPKVKSTQDATLGRSLLQEKEKKPSPSSSRRMRQKSSLGGGTPGSQLPPIYHLKAQPGFGVKGAALEYNTSIGVKAPENPKATPEEAAGL